MSHEQDLSVACLTGDVAVVDRLLQVPGVDATADDNFAIRMAAKHGEVAVVERLLRDERVVIKLGLAPQAVDHSSTRCAVAIAQCAIASQRFRKTLVAAFRLAYECVRNELMGGQICEWVWPYPLARQAVEVQRHLALALRQLHGRK
eukprot:TRINITY_DN759_c0_g1_i11.p1 TRINITY_DN759_c0_g1~~TRINITY_DN759_c0_g1_i11.p1  ORF type:complete len:147 (+),score=21.93 TRINITY_DN759_c0_g1_i11:57-497(+)